MLNIHPHPNLPPARGKENVPTFPLRGEGEWVQTGNMLYKIDRAHRLQVLMHRYGGYAYALETRKPDGSEDSND